MTTFVFRVFKEIPERKHHFQPVEVEVEGNTVQEALKKLDATHPGHCIGEHTKGLWRVRES